MSNCATCGHPADKHPFRHPFAGTSPAIISRTQAPCHECAEKDAEIARLNRIIDAERDMQAKLVDEGTRLSTALAAARAALAGERGHADEARRCVVVHEGRETGTNVTAFAKWRRDYDARRAAEAKDHLTGVGKMGDAEAKGVPK